MSYLPFVGLVNCRGIVSDLAQSALEVGNSSYMIIKGYGHTELHKISRSCMHITHTSSSDTFNLLCRRFLIRQPVTMKHTRTRRKRKAALLTMAVRAPALSSQPRIPQSEAEAAALKMVSLCVIFIVQSGMCRSRKRLGFPSIYTNTLGRATCSSLIVITETHFFGKRPCKIVHKVYMIVELSIAFCLFMTNITSSMQCMV